MMAAMKRKFDLLPCGLALGAAALGLCVPNAAALAQPAEAPVAALTLDGSALPGGVAVREGSQPTVWFSAAQRSAIGAVDAASRAWSYIPLGHGAKPRSVALCPNGKLFALDPALNVIHEVDPDSEQVRRHPMPGPSLDLQSSVCTASNELIFTGYAGWVGKLDALTGAVTLVESYGGRGPGAIALAGNGAVWFASYAGNHIVRVDPRSMRQDGVRLPQGAEGPKGLAVDASGRVWVSAFRSQRLVRYDARRRGWDAWRLGEGARPFAVAVEPSGAVLVTDTARDRLLRLDPADGVARVAATLTEKGQARAMARLGDEVWISEQAADRLLIVDLRASTN